MHRWEVRMLLVMLIGVIILAAEKKWDMDPWGCFLIGGVWGYFGLKFIFRAIG
jgi:hypothetical protein